MDWQETKDKLTKITRREFGNTSVGADLRGAYLRGAYLSHTAVFSFTAGRHFGFFTHWNRYLKIGCVGESLDWWLKNYDAIGRKNEYTDAEIARYGAIIKLIAELYPAK